MLHQLHLQIVDICVANDQSSVEKDLQLELDNAWTVVRNAKGHAWLCVTFDPYKFARPDFSEQAIRQLDRNFAAGAIAVKIWKNIGTERFPFVVQVDFDNELVAKTIGDEDFVAAVRNWQQSPQAAAVEIGHHIEAALDKAEWL
jgi:hypothetical protein